MRELVTERGHLCDDCSSVRVPVGIGVPPGVHAPGRSRDAGALCMVTILLLGVLGSRCQRVRPRSHRAAVR